MLAGSCLMWLAPRLPAALGVAHWPKECEFSWFGNTLPVGCWVWWSMPVIPAFWETRVEGVGV